MGYVTEKVVAGFRAWLARAERSEGTIEKYIRDAERFLSWLGGRPVTKEAVLAWKESLLAGRRAGTVNAMLAAVNSLLEFLGRGECRVKALRVQKEAFRKASRELTREEYQRLTEAAERLGRRRTGLVLETLCATGIRVSELRYITVEAAKQGQAVVSLKGKVRTILIPRPLAKKLKRYAEKRGIEQGEIFITRTGRSLGRKQIWAELKALCGAAGVEESKVYPHNLRHLFARTFYKACRDVAKLADVLGHSSINTTRIYLISTGEEHLRQLERLGLVS